MHLLSLWKSFLGIVIVLCFSCQICFPDNWNLPKSYKMLAWKWMEPMTIGQVYVVASLYSSADREPPAGLPTWEGSFPAQRGTLNYLCDEVIEIQVKEVCTIARDLCVISSSHALLSVSFCSADVWIHWLYHRVFTIPRNPFRSIRTTLNDIKNKPRDRLCMGLMIIQHKVKVQKSGEFGPLCAMLLEEIITLFICF
jgi:hypothetical protein